MFCAINKTGRTQRVESTWECQQNGVGNQGEALANEPEGIDQLNTTLVSVSRN